MLSDNAKPRPGLTFRCVPPNRIDFDRNDTPPVEKEEGEINDTNKWKKLGGWASNNFARNAKK